MSSNWGRNIRISIFGESHGASIGVVLDGLPPGLPIDLEQLSDLMARRAPGQGSHTTARREADLPQIQSGFINGRTTGTPLCALIANSDTRSGDYEAMAHLARPAHGDYTGFVRYGGYGDTRGGGHFSGRLTAPLVFAGGVALQALEQWGIVIGAQIASIHGIKDTPLDTAAVTAQELRTLSAKPFPIVDEHREKCMRGAIEVARMAGDSVGGVVACYAVGLPAGIGSPMFDGLENIIASILFGIPGVRGVEFGEGFYASELLGSQNNDPMRIRDGAVVCETNHHGGILGGISSGMPLIVRVAFKPTPSISKPQRTIDFMALEEREIEIKGRHDPCIVPRAVPCVEAAVALALMDAILEGGNPSGAETVAR